MKILARKMGKFVREDGTYVLKRLVLVEGYGWLPEDSLLFKRVLLKEQVNRKIKEKEVSK
ncbi:MAG: hypothetical protein J7K20_02020 [Thermodesulfobacterium sp.]|nr:hypothetical protein [Thermodesulfobacterium sp.]